MYMPELICRRRLLLPLLLLALASALPALGQDEGERTDPIESLEASYRVLPSSDGYVLTPKEDGSGFNLVEIEAGQVAVDGELVSQERLREVLGDDADLVFQLAESFDAEESEAEELERRQERLRELEEARNSQLEELREIEESLEEARRSERSEDRGRRRARHRQDTRMAFGNSLTIVENESARDVVVLGGSLEVLGEVRGDAVVIGGKAEVSGDVSGDLTVIGGSVLLGPGSKIGGEVVSIGGPVVSDPESIVEGGITELAMGPTFGLEDIDWAPGDWASLLWPGSWFQFGWSDTFDRIGNAIFLALIMMILVFVARKPVERVARRADREPWKSALVGLLVQILIGPVVFLLFILLMVSVVGIPLAVMLLPLSIMLLVIFFLVGYAGVAKVAGGWLEIRFDLRDLNIYVSVLLGIVLIQGWSILGEALSFGGGPIHFAAVLLILLGFILKYCVWTAGLGAVVLHCFSPAPDNVTIPPPPLPPSKIDDFDEDVEDPWSAGDAAEHAEWEEAAKEAEEAEKAKKAKETEKAEEAEAAVDQDEDEEGLEASESDKPTK